MILLHITFSPKVSNFTAIEVLYQVPPENAKIFDEEFVQDWWVSTKTVLRRQATLALRNTSFVYARNLQVLRSTESQS